MERRVREIAAQIETLRKTQTRRIEELGHDGASLELEEKTHQLLSAAEQHEILERMRDFAAEAYFKETLKVWAPRKKGASHVSQTGDVAARIDSREFLQGPPRTTSRSRKSPRVPSSPSPAPGPVPDTPGSSTP